MTSSSADRPDISENNALTWHVEDRIFVVQLQFPPANALGRPVLAGLQAALDEFDGSDARVLVLHSALDGFFAAGADIKFMAGAAAADFAAYSTALRAPLTRIATADRPSVAAVEGRALGGGLELAMACTLRVGTTAARLGLPEAKLGLIPGAGGTQRLPRLVGRSRALDIMLTGREVGAAEALSIGLLDRVVEPGTARDTAVALARELGGRSAPALTDILRCVDDAQDLPLADGLQREAERVTALFGGNDVREGLQAFVEKRPPVY